MYRRWSRRHKFLAFLVLVAAWSLIFAAQAGWFGGFYESAETNQPGLYRVARYVDGDTIDVYMDGRVETIRFIGVDTPEIHNPDTPIQCYGQEAADFTKSQISRFGKVRLQADPLDTNRDVYGRLLRYVYLPDGVLMEDQIIKNGYGFAYLDFPFSKKARFAADQLIAQKNKAGLWTACHPTVNKYGGYTSNPVE
jgi:micrococcal nuclease